MATATFSPPRHWEDWLSWLLGIWLALSPWILLFSKDSVPTTNAVVLGLLLIAVEVITLSAFRLWEEWLNVILGAWLIVSPWVLALSSPVATANVIVVGVMVVVLALYAIRDFGGRRANG